VPENDVPFFSRFQWAFSRKEIKKCAGEQRLSAGDFFGGGFASAPHSSRHVASDSGSGALVRDGGVRPRWDVPEAPREAVRPEVHP
jgi:hypothetical protein